MGKSKDEHIAEVDSGVTVGRRLPQSLIAFQIWWGVSAKCTQKHPKH